VFLVRQPAADALAAPPASTVAECSSSKLWLTMRGDDALTFSANGRGYLPALHAASVEFWPAKPALRSPKNLSRVHKYSSPASEVAFARAPRSLATCAVSLVRLFDASAMILRCSVIFS